LEDPLMASTHKVEVAPVGGRAVSDIQA